MVLVEALTRESLVRQLGDFVGMGRESVIESLHFLASSRARLRSNRCHCLFKQALHINFDIYTMCLCLGSQPGFNFGP